MPYLAAYLQNCQNAGKLNIAAATAATMLETDCGDKLPLIESQGVRGIERIRCAALKLSNGSLERLSSAIETAKRDWRDVLVAAGFGDDPSLHLSWLDKP